MEAILVPTDSEIYHYLLQFCQGKQCPMKAKDLAERFCTSLREINKEIRWLRQEGILIGSSKEPPYGYYIPASEQELKEYLDTFKDELFDMLRTFKAQRKAKYRFVEQQQYKTTLIKTEADKTGQLAFALT
jgi:biotin operon repressor